jgi:hypothetical protein
MQGARGGLARAAEALSDQHRILIAVILGTILALFGAYTIFEMVRAGRAERGTPADPAPTPPPRNPTA